MADDAQWQFCQLSQAGASKAMRGKSRYGCDIVLLGDTHVYKQIAAMDAREWDANPFYTMMRYLGEAGWELISVQHADTGGGEKAIQGATHLLWNTRVAYFKRKVVAGRPLDDVLSREVK